MNTFGISHLLLEIAIKSAVVLLAAIVLTQLMRGASAAVRHLVWTAAIVTALLLPIGSLVPQNRRIAVPALGDVVAPSAVSLHPNSLIDSSPAESIRAESIRVVTQPLAVKPTTGMALTNRPERIAVFIWLIGAVLVGMYWLLGWFATRQMRRSASRINCGRLFLALQRAQQQIGLHRTVLLRAGSEVGMPLTIHTWHPEILLPISAEEWPIEQLQSAMLHELAHIKRFDCAVQWLTHCACAAYWFNPLVWVAAVRLRLERERACDDLVLNLGANPASYAEHLLAVARALRNGMQWQTGGIAMARPSGLRQRLTDILNSGLNRRALSARLMFLAAIMALAAGVALSCVGPGAKKTNKPVQTVAAAQPGVAQPGVMQSGAERPVAQQPSAEQPGMQQPVEKQPVAAEPGIKSQVLIPLGPTTQHSRLVHVTVVNDETGAPVQGAGIDYGMGGPSLVTTDAQGHADIPMGVAGSLSAWCSHYINYRVSWANGVPAEYTFRLDPDHWIGGKVVDDAGKPVAGANVEIYVNGSGTHDGDAFIEKPWINRAVVTGADGTWRFERVPPHPAMPIKVAVWDYQHLDGDFFFLKPYTPQLALFNKTAKFTLHRSVVINGTVVDPFYGKPIPNAKVSFGENQSATNKIPPLTADANGAFKLAAQPGCKLFMTVTADGYRPEVKQQVVGDKPEDWEFDLSPTNWVK